MEPAVVLQDLVHIRLAGSRGEGELQQRAGEGSLQLALMQGGAGRWRATNLNSEYHEVASRRARELGVGVATLTPRCLLLPAPGRGSPERVAGLTQVVCPACVGHGPGWGGSCRQGAHCERPERQPPGRPSLPEGEGAGGKGAEGGTVCSLVAERVTHTAAGAEPLLHEYRADLYSSRRHVAQPGTAAMLGTRKAGKRNASQTRAGQAYGGVLLPTPEAGPGHLRALGAAVLTRPKRGHGSLVQRDGQRVCAAAATRSGAAGMTMRCSERVQEVRGDLWGTSTDCGSVSRQEAP